MFCTRNWHNVVDQLYFKNKLIEKMIRFVITRGGEVVGTDEGTNFQLEDK